MDRSRRRRVTIVAIAAIVAAVCVALGFWQLRRLADRRTRNAAIEREWSRDPVLITSAAGGEVEAYTPVRASGTFDAEREVLVYGRSLDGEPGHLVVTPLVLDDGAAMLVIRGGFPSIIRPCRWPTRCRPRTRLRSTDPSCPTRGTVRAFRTRAA